MGWNFLGGVYLVVDSVSHNCVRFLETQLRKLKLLYIFFVQFSNVIIGNLDLFISEHVYLSFSGDSK